MRQKDRLLGIEIHEGELRIAVVSEHGAVIHVDSAAHCKLAQGAVRHGTVLDTGSVAVALRRLIVSKGLGELKDAVIGIPAGGTVVRNLQVPPVPEDELVHIIAGEVDHYAIVAATGSHSFLRIHAPPKSTTELVSVVVAGAEANLIASLSEVASKADLNIVALEPVEFALSRMALATLRPTPTVFVITVTETSTNISFVRRGKLWAHRQLDTGASALAFRSHQPAESPEPLLDRSAVLALSKEIRRTLEYVGRAHPEDASEATIHLATNEPSMVGLANMLSSQIERGVRLHIPGEGIVASPTSRTDLETIESVRYSAAIGLALRANRSVAEIAPPVDLFASERTANKADVEQRNLVVSLAVSAVVLIAGIVGMLMIEGDISAKRKMISVLAGQVATIKQSTSEALKDRAAEIEQYRLLRSEGSPLVPLMDYITTAMPPQTSLTAVTIDGAHVVRIAGESTHENGVYAMLGPLQSVPVIQGPRLDSMRLDPEKNGYTFSIIGTLVGMDQVRMPRAGGVRP